MISFQFGLTQLPLSDSQELYLDLPGPKERPADSDDDDDDDEDVEEDEEEGKDERAEMLRVPIPSPSSVPVLGRQPREVIHLNRMFGKMMLSSLQNRGSTERLR